MSDPRRHSRVVTEGPSRDPARAMLKAVGFTDADLQKPLIGTATFAAYSPPSALSVEIDGRTDALFPRTSVRVRRANLNHHLWNNNGTWYLHYTMHPTPLTKSRVRVSLGTKSIETAREKRDAFFARARR